MEKVFMVPYNNTSEPDSALCIDGLNFSINEAFLLISNKPIAKHSKVYFEFTIKNYTQSVGRRNIPIYAGIHKEPSFGILNADFCIGSLFYVEGKDYDIIEKYNKTAEDLHRVPGHIYSKIPGATDVIGVSVDYDNNFICFYNNGKPFYSFYPSLFKINEEENFYLCIWGNIASDLKGNVNFGRNGASYLPDGYNTVYGEYYRKESIKAEISGTITVERPSTYGENTKEINATINVTNDIKGDGSLILLSETAIIKDDLEYTLPYVSSTNYLADGGNVFCNLPIPTNQKIYLELYVKEGELINNIIGVPVSIGVSNSMNTLQSRSMRMPLYHKTWHNYTYTEVKDLMPIVNQISDIDTSISPEQGKIIGVCLNLADNEISILIDKVPLYTFKAKNIDFRDQRTPSYLFLHNEGAYKNYVTGSFNFGATAFKDTVPNGYMSLFDYYNEFYLLSTKAEISGDITVKPYLTIKTNYISGDIIVVGPPDVGEDIFTKPGLNKLMKTYNTVTDTEAHQTVDKDITYLNASIKSANNGYLPDDTF
jgi:hypothetical protein